MMFDAVMSMQPMQKGVQPIKQDKLSKCQQPDATSWSEKSL